MTRVEVLDAAAQEAREARLWYAERDGRVADRFVVAFEATLRKIGAAPERYPAHLEGTRRCAFRGFPYWTVYRWDGASAIVVAHHRRRPGYWTRP